MSARLTTFSIFYFGHEVDATNNSISFNEGSGELTASLNPGSYSLTDFAAEVKRAMDAASTLPQAYTVSVNRSNRKLTVSASGTFSLLISSGTAIGTTAFTLMGFSGADVSGTNTYTGGSGSGSEFEPTVRLQDYIPSTQWREAADAAVNNTASGRVEVVSFGEKQFVQFNFKWVTNQPGDGVTFKTNTNAIGNLETFLQYLTTKAPFEFMPDIGSRSTFQTLHLESTGDYQTGTGYKIKELYDRGLAGWYESGPLKCRVIL